MAVIISPEWHESETATYLWVAETILRKHRRPLRAREIVSCGIDDGLFADRQISKTPQKSMQARLSIDILDKGRQSKFLRTGRGLFSLSELDVTSPEQRSMVREYTAIRRSTLPPSENVLVIGKEGYRNILDFQGIDVLHTERLRKLLSSKQLTYAPRTAAETDNNIKQFVTYTIIQNENHILCFRRGQYNRATGFLRGALCIGFGGHVTEDDLNIFSYRDHGILANAAREISEEIRFKEGRPNVDPEGIECLGILDDDSSDVGVRHLAVVLRYWAPSAPEWRTPIRGEASVNQLRWIDVRSAKINLLDFEYWSQLCLRRFYAPTVTGKPVYRILRRRSFRSSGLLCVEGAIGSGKSIATQLLRDEAGFVEVNSGQVLARLLGIPPVPETPRSEFQERAQHYISGPDGPRSLAQALINEADRLAHPRIIVDGIRHPETLEALRTQAKRPIAVLYIHTPPDVAYELYSLRETSSPFASSLRRRSECAGRIPSKILDR
jgi:predicted NUDIX family phosphoesterase